MYMKMLYLLGASTTYRELGDVSLNIFLIFFFKSKLLHFLMYVVSIWLLLVYALLLEGPSDSNLLHCAVSSGHLVAQCC